MGCLLSTTKTGATALASSSSVSNNLWAALTESAPVVQVADAVPAATNYDPSMVSARQVMPASAACRLGRTTMIVAPRKRGKTVLLRHMIQTLLQTLLRRLAAHTDAKVAVILITHPSLHEYDDLMASMAAATGDSHPNLLRPDDQPAATTTTTSDIQRSSASITWIQWDRHRPVSHSYTDDFCHVLVVVDDVLVTGGNHGKKEIIDAAFDYRYTLLYATQSLKQVPFVIRDRIDYCCFGRGSDKWELFDTDPPVQTADDVKENEFVCVAHRNPTTPFSIVAPYQSNMLVAPNANGGVYVEINE